MLRSTGISGAAVSYWIPRGRHVGSEVDLISGGCGLDKHSTGPRQGHHMENVLQPAISLSPSPFISTLIPLRTFCFPTCQLAASVGPSFLSSPVWPQSSSGGGRQVRTTRHEQRTNKKGTVDDGGGWGGGSANDAAVQHEKKPTDGGEWSCHLQAERRGTLSESSFPQSPSHTVTWMHEAPVHKDRLKNIHKNQETV